MIKMRDFFTQSTKNRNCVPNENGPRFDVGTPGKYIMERANDGTERSFYTKSQISTCLRNESGPRFDVGALSTYSIYRAND